jgi:hypothetical protein
MHLTFARQFPRMRPHDEDDLVDWFDAGYATREG